MVETLIKKLRGNVGRLTEGNCKEAADRLEALEREKEELRKEIDRFKECFEDAILQHNEQMIRAETAERQLAERDADLARLRVVISECASALGNGAHVDPRCTIEFMEMLPQEIRLHVAALAGSGDGWRLVPDGWKLVPIRPTAVMAYEAACAHYGKRRVDATGIKGMSMTVDGIDYSFDTAFKRFWKGALRSLPPLPASPSTAGER